MHVGSSRLVRNGSDGVSMRPTIVQYLADDWGEAGRPQPRLSRLGQPVPSHPSRGSRNSLMRNFELPGRSLAVARHGMAATSHAAATLTAVEILKAGGHAIDAAVAACAVQCVVEAGSTGVGGDCFAMISLQGSTDIRAYNGSGCAPAGRPGSNAAARSATAWYLPSS